jgi:choline-glycine betaine transporter
MKAEDLNKKLNQQPQVDPEQLKRSRRIAIVLATATIITILFLIYSFLQKLEADKNFELAEKFRMEAQLAQEEAQMQRALAEATKAESEKQRQLAEQALAECEKSKR